MESVSERPELPPRLAIRFPQGEQWGFGRTPRTEEAESRGIVSPLNSDSELQVLLKMRNQGHWAPLLGMYRKKLLSIKASGPKLN